MNNCDFGAFVSGSIVLFGIVLFSYGFSGIILAALYQFTNIDLFLYYNGLPIGMFLLTGIFLIIFIYCFNKFN